ncbi:hypothetical protein ACXR0O_25895 [Verrucomicrobiota bacterium sgz303538]
MQITTTSSIGEHWRRREFLEVLFGAAGAILVGPIVASGFDLPNGPQPEPVSLPHFPTPLHAFVWRNWSLVDAQRMADTVGATHEQIVGLGQSMGLDSPPRITAQIQARSAITIIRRNWHLLPYEQLLSLLGWTAEQLAFTLREDDFLYIKLGSLKPKCPPLRWSEPSEAAQRRAGEIAHIVREEFPSGALSGKDPLFAFVDRLSEPVPAKPRNTGGLRFCYSYFALYGDPLLDPSLDPYPDGYLSRLAAAGVNGVWLQGVLSKLAETPWEKDESAAKRRDNLRILAQRAARFGIKIFLYLNEPRSQSTSFFREHPDWRGVTEGEFATLCTSVREIRDGMRDAVATICRDVPELGGFFTITASENLTNCWSHGQGKMCPRCAERSPAEVIADVNACIHEGIVAAGGKQQLIAWDWGWADEWGQEAVERLPDGVSVMSVSEWSLPIERGGVKSQVGEYSLSAVGPGPRAQRTWSAARKRGLPVLAKIQAANSWELSSVPYIPALGNVAQHAGKLKAEGVDGIMLGWTLGGYPSPNLAAVEEILSGGSLDALAERRYGKALAEDVVAFWRRCSEAFREFPFHVQTVYNAPLQTGPANLLWARPTGYGATMVGLPYDDLSSWRSVYPPEIWAVQLEKTAAGFMHAVAALKEKTKDPRPAGPDDELRYAEAAALHWSSAAAQARFVLAREAKQPAENRISLLQGELARAKRLHALQSEDSRIGFEASNQYYYVPLDLVEKVLCCRWLAAE